MNRTYYLVLYDNKFPKGASGAKHLPLSEEDGKRVLSSDRVLVRGENGGKYKVTSKRIFLIKETTFIVVDADKVK